MADEARGRLMTDEKDANMDHEFDPGHTGLSDRCNALVMRDGAADDCGLPRIHSTHGLDPWCRGCNPEGESVYAPCAKHADRTGGESWAVRYTDGSVYPMPDQATADEYVARNPGSQTIPPGGGSDD